MNSIEAILIDSDENSRNIIKTTLEEVGQVHVSGIFDNIMSGYNSVIKDGNSIVFIDISENTDLALEIIEKISLYNRSCFIFVSSYERNPEVIIKAMRAGAREFLIKPLNQDELNSAIEKALLSFENTEEDDKTCKVFTVFSNKGGIGKTTIATNLALSLTELTGKKVALIDLNLQLGDVTTFLDINPSFDISYVVTHLNRIDESFLLTTLEKYKDKDLYVLADPPYLEQAEEITSDQISTVINILKSVFSYIIIDTGSNFDSKTLSALDLSDYILLVSMINLPSIRNTQRCLELFQRLGYNSEKVKLIINRYMPNEEITVDDVEDVLGHSVFWKIANNYFTVMSAINKGVPAVKINPDSNISKNFIELAGLLSNKVIIRDDKKELNISKKSSKLFTFIENFFKKMSKSKKGV